MSHPHKFQSQRPLRAYPKFKPGWTTKQYIDAYANQNSLTSFPLQLRRIAHVLPYRLEEYRRPAPVEIPGFDAANPPEITA